MNTENSGADPVSINAVAAALRLHACIRLRVGVWDCSCGESFPYADQYIVTLQEHQARVLAEAGWLRTAEDRQGHLLAEVLDSLSDWTVQWFNEPYEGWDAILRPLECEEHCYGCDGVNVGAEQVEAMRAFGIVFNEIGARRAAAGGTEAQP